MPRSYVSLALPLFHCKLLYLLLLIVALALSIAAV